MHSNALRPGGLRRALTLAAVAALAFLALAAQALYDPRPALACSCIFPMPTIAQVAAEPGTVVVTGTVAQQLPDRTAIAIDTWYWGEGVTDVAWLSFGSQGMTSCDPFVTVGERRLLVLHRQEPDLFSVNPCVESGVIGTESGDKALAAAIELWGDGSVPPTPAPTAPPESPTPTATSIDPGWLYVAAVAGGGALVLALVALLATRRRPSS
jgi:hypothetical protein